MNVLSLPKKSLAEGGLRHAEMRGFWLSHFIGFAFFVQIVFSRAITMELPFNKVTDLPIRLIAVWLILDRVGRIGKVKIAFWDWLHLGFAATYALMLVYADIFMVRETGLKNYLEWISQIFNPYLFFVIVREGTLRRGFQPYVVLRWVMLTLGFACLIALAQSVNALGLRDNIDDFVRQRQAEMRMEGPSMGWQARGLFAHANTMAIILIMGLALLFGASNYRRPGIIEYGCGALYVVTLFATFSRTGIVSAFLLALAVAALYALQRKYKLAVALVTGLACLTFVFLTLVYTLNIERYQVFLKGEGRIKNESVRGLYGVYARQEGIRKAWALANKYPLTGVNVATSALNEQMVLYKSAYTFEGMLLNVYAFTYVSYGIPGLLYFLGVLVKMLGQVRFVRTRLAFSSVAVLCGLAIMITGITENTLWQAHHMTVVNIVMALAVQRVMRTKEEQAKEADPFHGWARILGFGRLGQKPTIVTRG